MLFFKFKCTYKTGNKYKSEILLSMIKGFRNEVDGPREQPDDDPNIFWVKVEWCDYCLEVAEIIE